MSFGKGDEAVVGPGMDLADGGRDSIFCRPAAWLCFAGVPCNKNWRAWVWPRGESTPSVNFRDWECANGGGNLARETVVFGRGGNWELGWATVGARVFMLVSKIGFWEHALGIVGNALSMLHLKFHIYGF